MKTTCSSWARKGCFLAGAGVLATLVAAPAEAQTRVRVAVGAQRGQAWAPPVYPARQRAIAATPVYEDVVRRVWHEPIYETRRVPVHIPAQTITRKVPRYSDCGQYIVGWEYVEEVIEPARTEWRFEEVLVREGYYETVTERVMVRPPHTRVITGPAVAPGASCGLSARTAIRKGRPYGNHAPIRHTHGTAGVGFSLRFGN